jgi:hypothetical protein
MTQHLVAKPESGFIFRNQRMENEFEVRHGKTYVRIFFKREMRGEGVASKTSEECGRGTVEADEGG